MTDMVVSRGGVTIRLMDERWLHIVTEHAELAGLRADVLTAVAQPDRIVAGSAGELLALRTIFEGKMLVVVYREVDDEDGFVITAFLTRRLARLLRRQQVWP